MFCLFVRCCAQGPYARILLGKEFACDTAMEVREYVDSRSAPIATPVGFPLFCCVHHLNLPFCLLMTSSMLASRLSGGDIVGWELGEENRPFVFQILVAKWMLKPVKQKKANHSDAPEPSHPRESKGHDCCFNGIFFMIFLSPRIIDMSTNLLPFVFPQSLFGRG